MLLRCCIASSFYIKPQRLTTGVPASSVVLHPLSTSNHNRSPTLCVPTLLYCILFLHQTTTTEAEYNAESMLYCILFLHQTTTINARIHQNYKLYCILFLHQTTTRSPVIFSARMLYCILFLHQTTTWKLPTSCMAGLYCILFLHQTTTGQSEDEVTARCIASSFYIKPQPFITDRCPEWVVLHPLSTSNHNHAAHLPVTVRVVLHPLSTSNHNDRKYSLQHVCVVLHPLSTSNHNLGRQTL